MAADALQRMSRMTDQALDFAGPLRSGDFGQILARMLGMLDSVGTDPACDDENIQ